MLLAIVKVCKGLIRARFTQEAMHCGFRHFRSSAIRIVGKATAKANVIALARVPAPIPAPANNMRRHLPT